MKLLKTYIRSDNKKTWIGMLGSLLGFFLPELINALWTKNRTAYWLLFIGSMISFMLFIILAFQYVDRWHNIIDTLRCKNASLYKTVSLYAVMSKSESVGHVNKTVKVKKIDVTYQFREEHFTDREGNLFFPFQVTYAVDGRASTRFSTLYYHLLGHKSSQKIKQMEITLNQSKVTPQVIDDQGNVQVICFSNHNSFNARESIHYSITVPFDSVSGLASNKKQSFLFFPKNISYICEYDAVAVVRLVMPSAVELEKKYQIIFTKYIDGLCKDPKNERFEPKKETDFAGNLIYKWIQPLHDNLSSIYIIEFYNQEM